MPHNHHVTKVAQSATATWRQPFQINLKVGPETFLKDIIFCKGIFFLQGPKPKLAIFAKLNFKFKPLLKKL